MMYWWTYDLHKSVCSFIGCVFFETKMFYIGTWFFVDLAEMKNHIKSECVDFP